MGYVPNFMARRLSARQSQTIGVIVPKIAHFFFSTVIQAIYDAAFENKYEILLMVSQENAEREALHLQTLLSMRVDGLIVSISQETRSPSVFRPVVERGIPLEQLRRASEVWLTSSTREVLPVVELDGRPVGTGEPGPLWRQVSAIYQAYKQQLRAGS